MVPVSLSRMMTFLHLLINPSRLHFYSSPFSMLHLVLGMLRGILWWLLRWGDQQDLTHMDFLPLTVPDHLLRIMWVGTWVWGSVMSFKQSSFRLICSSGMWYTWYNGMNMEPNASARYIVHVVHWTSMHTCTLYTCRSYRMHIFWVTACTVFY